MIAHRPDSSIALLLGAGFNYDAYSEAGAVGIARYPLVADLAKECFNLDEIPPEKGIEELFQEAINDDNRSPLDKLYHLIMKADYYLAPMLSPGGNRLDNSYLRMLQDFPSVPILTFNYDSLVEILLLNLGHWRPEDGYGVPVHAELDSLSVRPAMLPEQSLRPVLHLHGTACVYPSTFEIKREAGKSTGLLQEKPEPDFIFDPDAIADRFFPFERILPGLDYQYIHERCIAPIPSKAEGLRDVFISQIYKRAVDIIKSVRTIVVIGYSFNRHDRDSYLGLLEAAHGARMVLVVPEAEALASRLSAEHPGIAWQPVSMTFGEWVNHNYIGL